MKKNWSSEDWLMAILVALLIAVPLGAAINSTLSALRAGTTAPPSAVIERRDGRVVYLSTRHYARLSNASTGTQGYKRGFGRRIAAHTLGAGERHFYRPGNDEEIRLVTPEGTVMDRYWVDQYGYVRP